MDLVKEIYVITSEFPVDEKFVLISQINRSAISIPSNIAEGSAEGSGRSSEKEFVHFLIIAISSSYELETQLILIQELYKREIPATLKKLESLQKMIGAFKRKLKNEL